MREASTPAAESLLAIDIGTVNTRAFLFDTVDGMYRFVAASTVNSTVLHPYLDASEGIRQAVMNLQELTGRTLMDATQLLIIPANLDGSGVDACVATLSAGEPLKIITLGLLDEVSVESTKNLAASVYGKVVDTFSITDRRKIEQRVDDILRQRPDVIIAAGGTDQGASKSVLRLLDAVGIACLLMPKNQRPHVLFAGNPGVADQVTSVLEEISQLHLVANIRPTLETEQLGPALGVMREIFRNVQMLKQSGLQEVDGWAANRMMPASSGFGRIIQFLSRYYESPKGVLGVDLGASSTVLATGHRGVLKLNVFPHLGIGPALIQAADAIRPADVARWLHFDLPEESIEDFIMQKGLHPASLPITAEDQALEHALARELIRAALSIARRRFPAGLESPRPGLLPLFEPIVASGSLLSKTASRGQALLTLLDALEPTGITTIVLDQHNMLNALGAAAEVNPLLAVQVLDSGALLNLGTVIAPVGNARPGTPVLRVRMKLESGEEKQFDVNQGALQVIPLAPGQIARMQLRPLQRHHLGLGGPGRGGNLRVVGGTLGVIIDARGRPLQFSKDKARQQEMNKKWLGVLGK